MKLSEWIIRLQELKDVYGDLDVYHDGCGEYAWQLTEPSLRPVNEEDANAPSELEGKLVVLV